MCGVPSGSGRVVTQNLQTINPAFFVNRGKLEEIKMMVDATDAEVVILIMK